MKQYKYRAFDAKGVIQEDTIWADSSEEIVQKLQYQGCQIIGIIPIKCSAKDLSKWRYKDIIEFSYRMSLLLEAGLCNF